MEEHLESRQSLSTHTKTKSQAKKSTFFNWKLPKMLQRENKEEVRGRQVTTPQTTYSWGKRLKFFRQPSSKRKTGHLNPTTSLQLLSLVDYEKLTYVLRGLDMLQAIQSRSQTEVVSRRQLMSASYLTTMLLTSLEWTAKEQDIRSEMKLYSTQHTQEAETQRR